MNKNSYECVECNFRTKNLKDWKRHITTQKHKKNTTKSELFYCVKCNKSYNFKSGLSRHIKSCNISNHNSEIESFQNILNKVIEENANTIRNIIPFIGNTTNKMTINVFLNEAIT